MSTSACKSGTITARKVPLCLRLMLSTRKLDIRTADELLELMHDTPLFRPMQEFQFQGLQFLDSGLIDLAVHNYGLFISIYLTLNLFQECKHKHFMY